MSKAIVELDFFGMEKDIINTPKPLFPRTTTIPRQRCLRDIQGAISKINPELLKSVIASGYRSPSPEANANQLLGSKKPPFAPSSPMEGLSLIPTLPSLSPISRLNTENIPDTAPLTIFYNGTVTVFDVPKDKAETILKFAGKGISKAVEPAANTNVAVASADRRQLLETLNEDLPIARKKSLQRFLEKRKERLTSASPYCFPA